MEAGHVSGRVRERTTPAVKNTCFPATLAAMGRLRHLMSALRLSLSTPDPAPASFSLKATFDSVCASSAEISVPVAYEMTFSQISLKSSARNAVPGGLSTLRRKDSADVELTLCRICNHAGDRGRNLPPS